LLDHQRLSVLYMDSGKTKKKVPKIDRLLSDAQVLTCSSNGSVWYFLTLFLQRQFSVRKDERNYRN